MIRSSVRERADDNKVWVVRNTTIYGRGIVKRGETKRRQLGHPAPPVSASYVGDSSLGLSVDAGSPESRSNETRSTTTRFIFSTRAAVNSRIECETVGPAVIAPLPFFYLRQAAEPSGANRTRVRSFAPLNAARNPLAPHLGLAYFDFGTPLAYWSGAGTPNPEKGRR